MFEENECEDTHVSTDTAAHYPRQACSLSEQAALYPNISEKVAPYPRLSDKLTLSVAITLSQTISQCSVSSPVDPPAP